MKNVTFIIPSLEGFGGIARVTTIIANELSKERYNIQLVSFEKVKKPVYSIDSNIKILDLGIEDFNIRKHTLLAAFKLRMIFSSDYNGTFVIDDVGHNIPAWLGLKQCKNAKFISWSHMHFFNGSRWGFSGWGKRLAVKKFSNLVALTKEDVGYYNDKLKANNVIQIYNPIDNAVIKEKYQADAKRIISCGRLHPVKGFDILIHVARKVFDKVNDWHWDIWGEGPERERLENMINRLGLENNVHLKGYEKNIYTKYKHYSLNVFTSRSEGCPMAMIEAQSAGLPIISFDFKCGPKDLIVNGENGYIIDNWNVNEMSDKILHLINNRDLRIKFATKTDLKHGELQLDYVMKQWKKIL